MAARFIPPRGLPCFPRLLSTFHPQCSLGTRTPHLRPVLVSPVAGISSSCALKKDPNTPKKSGDRGPQKNFERKMAKKDKHRAEWGDSGMQLESLLEGMKIVDHEGEKGNEMSNVIDRLEHDSESSPEERLSSDKEKHLDQTGRRVSASPDTADLMDLLSGMKLTKSDESSNRARKSEHTNRRDHSSCQFLDPTAGPRMGLFDHPKPGVTLMPPSKPTYSELDEKKKLQALLLLKPWCYYDDLIGDRNVQFPRQFPVDNENYDQGEEAKVGFEDHVLLEHLLLDFPKKGPIRHFMELVVTGLSKNPNYTAAEKREIVGWYSDYFSEFSLEELQSLQQQSGV